MKHLWVALATTAALLACGGGSSSDPATPPVPPPATPPTPEVPPPVVPPQNPGPGPITPGAYPGYTYKLPAQRPYISLDDFNGVNRTSAPYTRLKAQVDDAVRVTADVAQSATYEELVAALNAGHYGYSAADSVLMYRLSGDVQYIDQALRMVDLFIASENRRIDAGTRPAIAGDSYLEVGHFMEQVALAYDYGYARLTPARRAAWEAYASQALYNVWNPGSAKWGSVSFPWSGWSIDDPGNNYYYSFIKATSLWALATKNTTLITFLQQQKYTRMVPFFHRLAGGGSREGTGYGTALGSLFENYRYWKSSTGEDLAALTPHARDSIDYWIHATVPTLDYYAAIGDQARSSMPRMFDYQRKLMEEAVALSAGTDAGRRGTWWLNRIKVTDGGSGSLVGAMRYNYNFRYDLLARGATELAPAALSYDAVGVGALFARSDWSEQASWISFVAGVYDQSHAHQDQGSFSLYRNGWLSVTSNIYSRSGINQGVALQNIVRFDLNGVAVPQNNTTLIRTIADSADLLRVTADLSAAYSRNAQQVRNWVRTLSYRRSTHTWLVRDQCTVAQGVQPVWQLHLPLAPVQQQDGTLVAGKLRIKPIEPAAPAVRVVDMRASSIEYNGGYRLELRAASGCGFEVELQAL